MPFLLRKVRKAKWYKNENVEWLPEGELQADALADLKTDNNTLSVYLVEDDRSNLERIAAAMVATGDNLSNFDYALVELNAVVGLEIDIALTSGDTPDGQVNMWHRDLHQLSATKLYELAITMHKQAEFNRILEKNMIKVLVNAVSVGHLDPTKLPPAILNKISPHL